MTSNFASASLGGLTSSANMTPEQRVIRSRRATLARELGRLERGVETYRARKTRERMAKWQAAFDELDADA
jgi:hypothetical protein